MKGLLRRGLSWTVLIVALYAVCARAMSSTDYQLVGPDGKVSARLTTSNDGTPALFFFDKQGRNRMNLSLYPEGTPGIVMNDTSERAVAILRMHGTHERPVLVFKANGGDRMVLGLRDDGSFTPYIEPMPEGAPSTKPTSTGFPFSIIAIAGVVGLLGGIVGAKWAK